METFDVVVIGAGPGGYPAAIRAAQLGARTAIVEKEHLGGTCLNWGCIPTKAMIAASEFYAKIKQAELFGITVKGLAFDYAALLEHKDKTVGQLRAGIKQLLAANRVTQFAGTASFKERHTIDVSGTFIGAKAVIIATGSISATTGFLPQHDCVVESRRFLELTTLPDSLIVMGGGYIGCELACMAAQFGSKVTIVELLDDVLLLLDSDARREVRLHMEKNLGIRILTGKALENITAGDAGVRGICGGEALDAKLLLVSVGRKPVTESLKLENAGLKPNDTGCVEADEFGRTKVSTIYAIGDVTGKTQLAHYATAQAMVAAANACGKKLEKHDTLVPGVIFTSPEVALVGVTEEEAKKKRRAVKTGKFRLAGLGRAIAVNETAGFVKWIADADTDQLLGATAVGAHATELIAEATVAIRSELTAHEVGRTIHAHPTFSEAWMEAAHAVRGTCLHTPPRNAK